MCGLLIENARMWTGRVRHALGVARVMASADGLEAPIVSDEILYQDEQYQGKPLSQVLRSGDAGEDIL